MTAQNHSWKPYRKYEPQVRRVVSSMLRNRRDDVDDVVQEVWIRLWTKWKTFRGTSKRSNWVHRVTVNAVLMYLRRENASNRKGDVYPLEYIGLKKCREDDGVVEFESPAILCRDRNLDFVPQRLDLQRALSRLPRLYYNAVLRHDIQGRRYADFAGPVGTEKSTVSRGHHKLRAILGDNYQGGPK